MCFIRNTLTAVWIRFTPENLVLSDIVKEMITVEMSSLKLKDISIDHIISDEIMVFADKNMLKTTLHNLISNAIKFTHNKGNIEISYYTKNNDVEISISDNGVGMREELKTKLFIVGEQSTSKGTNGEKGTGLGLILCKEFVEKQGGKIWVESKVDKGSIFRFTLPMPKTN